MTWLYPKTTKIHWLIHGHHIEFSLLPPPPPHSPPPQKKKKSPKEGEITYRAVSRFNACVCAFLTEANSSTCKRLADRDPVLHNSQFVDVQISWLQSIHKHYSLWNHLPNSCLFKRKKIQALSGLQLKEETRNPFLYLGGSQAWMNENVDLHFSHTDKGWMSFPLL